MHRRFAALPLVVVAMLSPLIAGCARVDRSIQVTSNPPGALVYLNGQEAGRTPMNKAFIWYGTYDVQLRKEGYETLTTKEQVWAPWWQIPPIDLIADIVPFPLHDQHKKTYTLTPLSDAPADAAELLSRGAHLREQLEGSHEKETKGKQDEAIAAAAAAAEKARSADNSKSPATKP